MSNVKSKKKAISPAKREAAKKARQAKIEQLNQFMAQAEEQGLAESPEFEDFSKSFERYSVRNQLLILTQNPNATQVMGYRAWQAEGRQVKKGSKALMIFGPAKKMKIEDEKSGEEKTISLPPPVVSVFDISQTEPIDVEEKA